MCFLPMHIWIIPAICPQSMRKVSRGRSMRQMLPATCVILCFVTVRIFRCSRLSGVTERDSRQGKPEFVPAYTMEDAMGVIRNFVSCPYEKAITPAEGISVRFVDAGHLLGSASIELTIREGDKEEKIVFSGDIGNTGSAADQGSGVSARVRIM